VNIGKTSKEKSLSVKNKENSVILDIIPNILHKFYYILQINKFPLCKAYTKFCITSKGKKIRP
jgi:hypothetical protein